MRIAHVARRFTPTAWGGTESVVAALARAQRQAGHAAEVLCTAALDRPGSADVLGVPVRRFRYSYARVPLSAAERAALDRKGGNPLAPGLVAALLAGPRPQVVHCHTMQRLAGQARWAARRRGAVYVIQLHGGEFDVPAEEIREMAAPGRRSLDWGKLPAALLGTRAFLRDADLVLALSSRELERARAALPGVRVERLPNGVDPSRFTSGDRTRGRARIGLPETAPLLLTVARVDPQKNQLAIPELLAALPAAHAALVGPVTVPGYDEQVRARAAELGVGDRLHLLGALAPESDELVDLYRAADLFVLPSRHEPFGIVVLEAWAAGVPVVAARVGGLGELIDDGRTGRLCDPADGAALARVARELLAGPSRGELVAAARDEVDQRYAWPAVAARLERLYLEVREEVRP